MYINDDLYNENMFLDLPALERNCKYGHQAVPEKVGGICSTKWLGESKGFINGDYLEVGTFDGIIISMLAEKNSDNNFYAIDLFSNGYNTGGGCLRYFIENNKHLPNVHLYIGTSIDTEQKIKDLRFDTIFIDGDHSYEWVKNDITVCYPLLKEGGMMLFHDYDFPEVRSAIDSFNFKMRIFRNVVWGFIK